MAISIEQKIKTKWAKNTERARDNYEAMVKLVTENPMALAAANSDKWAAKLEDLIKSGKWKEIMSKIPAEYWSKIVTAVGPDHFVDGVRTKAFKVDDFASKWSKTYEPELAKIRALPVKTDADREKRMVENRKTLVGLKGKWR